MQLIENHEFLVPSQPRNHSQENSFVMAITSREQRREYKAEFDKYYAEYQRLYTEMLEARERFKKLQADLAATKKHEERKYRELQMKILREYGEYANNRVFQQKRQRFDYLHEKLSTIKRLVSDYDSRHRNRQI